MTHHDLSAEPVQGLRLASCAAGIRYQDRDDLVLIALPPGSHCAATFTRNAFCAAPVTLARAHLGAAAARWWLINAGNANAGTGKRGLADAQKSCQALADLTETQPEQVLPFSTGVIGEPLPVERITAALPALVADLAQSGWERAARAIMTTDTRPKLVSRSFQVNGRSATLTGMSKGAGMICPDMATMLAFLATDAAVEPRTLQQALSTAVNSSFNAITVDGDTSTNDACVLAATGALGNPPIDALDSVDGAAFLSALNAVCVELATAIVRDGEGATKLVTVQVQEANDLIEARQVAYAVAHSPLVKTALFASDPNWGRILAAVGRAGVSELDIGQVRIWIGDVQIVDAGALEPTYTESAGASAMANQEILIRIALGRGLTQTQVLTCDFSYDYVRINAEYRS